MHILLIHQAFVALDEPGGTRHHELAHHLAARGHHVTIIASPVSYLTGTAGGGRVPWVTRQNIDDNISVLRAYTYPALHRSFAHRVVSFLSFMVSSFLISLRVDDLDLVWGTSPPIFQGATAWALARLKRVPFLFEVRDLWPAFAVAVGVLHQPLLIRMSEWLEGFLYRHADQVIVNSPGFIDHVTQRGARDVTLVPNGADENMFNPNDDGKGFRIKYEFGESFIAMYAGAHGISNDLDVVLAAAELIRDDEHITIVLVGDGKEKPALQEQARAMDLQNVRFLPPVPKTEMPGTLAAADACIAILKSIPLYATVYPNKVFDYMAAGRPILLAIDGVIREVVEQADAGVFVPPGDPRALADGIQRLAADRAEGRRLGLNGRRYLEAHFNRTALAENLTDLIEATILKENQAR
jgi:glycosyltransferase involved in cell wall biosynthesis